MKQVLQHARTGEITVDEVPAPREESVHAVEGLEYRPDGVVVGLLR